MSALTVFRGIIHGAGISAYQECDPTASLQSPTAMGFHGRRRQVRMELEVSCLWPARRQIWIDGRRGLGLEWQTSPAASRVTEQPCSGSALLTSHEEGPRKGGPNIAHSTFPGRDTALVEHLYLRSTSTQNIQMHLPVCELERTYTTGYRRL